MKTSFLLSSGALLVGALSSVCAAQQQPAPSAPANPTGKPMPEAHMASMPQAPARASKLIGTEIVDATGKEIAEIKDLLVAEAGEVVACVERKDDMYTCVPLASLEPHMAKVDASEAKEAKAKEKAESGDTTAVKQFTLKGDRAVLDSAPAVKDAKQIDRAWVSKSMDHFAGRTTGETAKPSEPMPGHENTMAVMKPCCVKTLIGEEVKGTEGDKLGDVKDLAIDLHSDRVAYAIISVGGVLGMGDSLHAIAFEKLTLNDGSVTIPMTKDSVANLPKLDIDRLPMNPTASVPLRNDKAEKGTERKGG